MKRWLKWGAVIISVLLIIVLGFGYWFTHRSLPTMSGEFAPGVEEEVVIYRDEYSIPHIVAQNEHDLFFAQGYTHAQDRLWQLDLSRRAISGRLSEILGPDFVSTDFYFRSLMLRPAAEAAVDKLSIAGKLALESYAEGINAYIDEHQGNLPLEFTLLGYQPEPWTVADSLSIGKYMAWDLGGNMETELFLYAASTVLPAKKLAELFPSYPNEGPSIITELQQDFSNADLEKVLALAELNARVKSNGIAGQELGSNNWVLSGSMTESGKPLLANDMHLGLGVPSIWYQTRLEIPGRLQLSGIMFPGIPCMIVGQNEHIAWGVTNVGPDVQDLFREKQHPENPLLFEYDGEWEEAEVREELIYVKGEEEPVRKEIIITRNGPIVSEVVGNLEQPLSLRWTAQEITQEVEAVIQFARATNWEEFKQALEFFQAPAQNFVFADREGNIAYRANGHIPIRAAGDGLLPAPGWDPNYQWQGYIPYDHLPTMVNPEEGFIVTANNRVAGADYPYFISHQWAPPYRAMAIRENLEDKTGLTVEDMMALQNNWQNLQARNLLPVILPALDQAGEDFFDSSEKEALNLLAQWGENPVDEPDLAGPAIFHTFYLKMLEATFLEELGTDLYSSFLSSGTAFNTLDRMLLTGESAWWTADEDLIIGENSLAFTPMTSMIHNAFKETVAELKDTLGGNPVNWQWGELHQVTFNHNLGSVPPLNLIYNVGPFPYGGSCITPGAASYSLNNPFAITSAAPWRYVTDLNDLTNAWEALAIGVSGSPFSPHYDDQAEMWLNGEYKPILVDSEDIKEAAGKRVTLLKP